MNRRNFITAAGAAGLALNLPRLEASTYTSPLSSMTALNALTSQMMHISVIAPDNITMNDMHLASEYYNALKSQMILDKFDVTMKSLASKVTVDQLMNHPVDLHYIYNHMRLTHPSITYTQVQNIYASTLPQSRGAWAVGLDSLKTGGLTPSMGNMAHYYAGMTNKPRSGSYIIPTSFCNGGYDTAVTFLGIAGMTIFVMSTGGIGLLAGAGWLAMANGIGYFGFGYGVARVLCA